MIFSEVNGGLPQPIKPRPCFGLPVNKFPGPEITSVSSALPRTAVKGHPPAIIAGQGIYQPMMTASRDADTINASHLIKLSGYFLVYFFQLKRKGLVVLIQE